MPQFRANASKVSKKLGAKSIIKGGLETFALQTEFGWMAFENSESKMA